MFHLISRRAQHSASLRRHLTHFPLATQRLYSSHFSHIEPQGLDAIKQLTIEYQKDSFANKVLLGEGVYKTNEGKPHVLKSVRMAEDKLYNMHLDHEYAPVSGVPEFCEAARKFALGEQSEALDRTATVQAVSGTGALRLAAAFLRRFLPQKKDIYVPAPTWMNHHKIFGDEGFNVKGYSYYDKTTKGMDVQGCLNDIRNAPQESIILFHACAHNPTGVDPSMDTWKELSKICKEKNHVVFFDSAYQGFASGDPQRDAASFRYFIQDGHTPLVCQSFSKNFGLYGERAGALQIVCDSPKEATAVHSQLMVLIRAMYSNPPLYGARIVQCVFNDAAMSEQWHKDVIEMADRIKSMREGLVNRLEKLGSPHNWTHITDQIGMFAFSGLTDDQVEQLKKDYHIYMTKDGRLSISGLNTHNLDYVAQAIDKVTRK
eukprot:CAMPEP_0117444470 /NCGR_PEP_ID=MMETSP0759-20121206/5258_1 /TAXON_ID=63605 /ORGANISM="Percolomonas cosmopolitus, Strain WS" /LENGTH=430 /DNA_ID=CAMNT_0005236539 /DNA_START=80 /DNA_END=1372 /DNA_ORIENTATION=+